MPVWPPYSASACWWACRTLIGWDAIPARIAAGGQTNGGSRRLLLCLLLLACACAPRPQKIIVGRIIIDAPRAFDDQHTAREDLRKRIAAQLQEASSLTLASGEQEATHLLQVVLSEPIALPEGGSGRVVAVRLRPTAEHGVEFATSHRTPERGDLGATALEGFTAAWKVMEQIRRLDVAKDSALIAALGDGDSRVREFAIRRVGERKLRDAVDPLCKNLESEPDPNLTLRSIGALMAIGDARAVDPLIAASHQKDTAFVMQVVFAVGALGGRTAEAYLVTVASGHPDEEVRRSADDALKDLRRHAKAAAKQP